MLCWEILRMQFCYHFLRQFVSFLGGAGFKALITAREYALGSRVTPLHYIQISLEDPLG